MVTKLQGPKLHMVNSKGAKSAINSNIFKIHMHMEKIKKKVKIKNKYMQY